MTNFEPQHHILTKAQQALWNELAFTNRTFKSN